MDEWNPNKILSGLYYDPEKGLGTAQQLYSLVKDLGITLNEVNKFLDKQEGHQIVASKKKLYIPIIGRTNADYQMDVMFLHQYKKYNDGYIGLLNIIEITSRKAFSIPIKNKTLGEYSRAFDIFYKQVEGKINNITTDNEASFKKVIGRYDQIKHWLTDKNDKTKLGKVERYNRTIRSKINRYMKTFHTVKWIDVIDKLVTNYNNSVHSIIKMKPNEVKTDEDFDSIRQRDIGKNQEALIDYDKIQIGDHVRVLKNKKIFEKGSEEFTKGIYEVIEKSGYSYLLKNPNGTKLKKHYKNWQLRKIDEVQKPQIDEPISLKQVRKENKFVNKQKRERIETNEEGQFEIQNKLEPKTKGYLRNDADPYQLIGKRLSIYWPRYKQWWSGKVVEYIEDRGEHIVRYDEPDTTGNHDIYERLVGKGKDPWKFI